MKDWIKWCAKLKQQRPKRGVKTDETTLNIVVLFGWFGCGTGSQESGSNQQLLGKEGNKRRHDFSLKTSWANPRTGRFPNLYFWPWKLVLPVGNSCWCTLYTPISRPCETQCSSYSPWVRMPWVIFQALQEDIATDGHLLSSCCGCWSGWPFRWSWKAAKMINLKSTCHLMISRVFLVFLCNFTLHTCRLRWRISSLQEIHPRRSGWKLPTRRRHSKKSRWKHEKISFAMWVFSSEGLHPPFGSFRSPGTGRSKVAEQKWKELTMLLPTGCNLRTWSLWMDWL